MRERHVIKVKDKGTHEPPPFYEHRVTLPWGSTLKIKTPHPVKDVYVWWLVCVYCLRKVNWALVSALVAIFLVSIYASLNMNDAGLLGRVVSRCAYNMSMCSAEQLEMCKDEIVNIHSYAPSMVDELATGDQVQLITELRQCFETNKLVQSSVTGLKVLQLVLISAFVWLACFMGIHVVVNLSVNYSKTTKTHETQTSAKPESVAPSLETV